MEGYFKRLSSLVTRRGGLISLISLAGAIVFALLVFRIEFRTDLTDVLPANDPRIIEFKGFLADFGAAENLVLAVEPTEGSVLEHLDFIEDLVQKLQRSANIDSVEYNAFKSANGLMLGRFPLFLGPDGLRELKEVVSPEGLSRQIQNNREAILSPVSSPAEAELISKDPLGLASIMLRHMPHKGLTAKTGYFTNKDESMLLILVRPKHPSRDLKFLEAFSTEMDGIIKEAQTASEGGIRVGITGPYAFAMEAHASLKGEIFKNFLSSGVVIILLFQLVYRKRPLVLILTTVTLLSALSYTLATAYLLFGGLNMISSVVAVMLLGMGIDYIIHMFNRWEEAFKLTGDAVISVKEAFSSVFPGIATGAVTTALAFASIVFTDFRGLYEFGIIAAIGVVSCLLMMVFFMCPCLVLFPSALASKRPQKPPLLAKAARSVISGRKVILAAGIIIMAACAVLIPSLGFDSDPESIGIKNSPAARLEKKVSEAFSTGKNPLIAITSGPDRDGLFKAYSDLEERLKRLEREKVSSSHRSLSIFLPPLDVQKAAIEALPEVRRSASNLEKRFLTGLRENGFKADEYQIKYIRRISEALNDDRLATLSDLEGTGEKRARAFYNPQTLRTAAYVFAPGDGAWTDSSIKAVQDSVASTGSGAYLTGAPIMLKTLKRKIITDSTIAAILTFLMITAVVYLQFRSLRRSLIIQAVLAADFLITLGVMAGLGVKFNYMNIAAVALILGIGVDYSVYVMQGYLEASSDLSANLATTWKSVIMCAFTTLAGFGSLMTMSFSGLASLGFVISTGVVVCLLTSLTLLPAIIAVFDNAPPETSGKKGSS